MSEVTTAAFAPPAVAGVAANHRYQWGTDHRLGPGGPNGDAVAASSRSSACAPITRSICTCSGRPRVAPHLKHATDRACGTVISTGFID